MARYEQDGYCPFNGVTNYCFSKEGQDHGHEWHYGLWRVFGPNVVFASKKANGSDDDAKCESAFTTDPIAEDLMMGIIRANANASKIQVRQLHNGAKNTQKMADVQKVLAEATAPKLIAKAGSHYLAIIDSNGEELVVWLWDLDCMLD